MNWVHACASAAAAALLLGGCAERQPRDMSAFLAARPACLLVMPPVNATPDVHATPAVWAQATRPLAEAGYYVLPASLVDAMLRENGVTTAHDAAGIPCAKLREVFGADAAVYLEIKHYGTDYAVVSSQSRVELIARIVDLHTGSLLWDGHAVAASSGPMAGNGLVGVLVSALVNQVAQSASDAAYTTAGSATWRLFAPGRGNGILTGPRRPVQDGNQAR